MKDKITSQSSPQQGENSGSLCSSPVSLLKVHAQDIITQILDGTFYPLTVTQEAHTEAKKKKKMPFYKF